MTPDLHIVVWTVVLAFVQMLVAVTGALTEVSLPTLFGNREDMPELKGWVGRAERAHLNMLENLPLFIVLVLVAHIAVPGNATALLGAQIFFWARLVYAIVYIAGIPVVRTLVWTASIVGLIVIVRPLL
jgi:uncharacterized MAPEG superfamily protein